MSMLSNALSAYTNAAQSFGGGTTGASSADSAASSETSFASMVRDGLQSAISVGKQSEAMSKAALTDKADIRDVVAAVNNAEVTLQTVVAVRDKVISAYNDILHMAI